MTEAEAIHFLQKCERLWLGQKNLTPGKVISKTWQSCFSVIVSGLTLAFSLAFNYFQIDKGSTRARFDVFGVVFALILIGIPWQYAVAGGTRRDITTVPEAFFLGDDLATLTAGKADATGSCLISDPTTWYPPPR